MAEPAALPGLEPAPVPDGPLVASATKTIDALRSEGLLEDRHELTCTLVLQLARVVDRGFNAPKVSVATATLSKHLLEAIDSLPQPVEMDGAAWADFEAKLQAASQ